MFNQKIIWLLSAIQNAALLPSGCQIWMPKAMSKAPTVHCTNAHSCTCLHLLGWGFFHSSFLPSTMIYKWMRHGQQILHQSWIWMGKFVYQIKFVYQKKNLKFCFKKETSLNVIEFSVSVSAKPQSKEQKYLLVLVLKQKICRTWKSYSR